jgi:hypothetical protein
MATSAPQAVVRAQYSAMLTAFYQTNNPSRSGALKPSRRIRVVSRNVAKLARNMVLSRTLRFEMEKSSPNRCSIFQCFAVFVGQGVTPAASSSESGNHHSQWESIAKCLTVRGQRPCGATGQSPFGDASNAPPAAPLFGNQPHPRRHHLVAQPRPRRHCW